MNLYFCDELIKVALDEATKARLKQEAKLIGTAGAAAGAAHLVGGLGRIALEKKYGPQGVKALASRAGKAGLPTVVALGTYLAGKAMHKGRQQVMDEAEEKGRQLRGPA
jgi:hypothetical protein